MGVALPFSDWFSVVRTVGTRILLEFGSKVTTGLDGQRRGRGKNFPRRHSTRNTTRWRTGSAAPYARRLWPLSSAWIQPMVQIPFAACFGTTIRPTKFVPSGEGSNENGMRCPDVAPAGIAWPLRL